MKKLCFIVLALLITLILLFAQDKPGLGGKVRVKFIKPTTQKSFPKPFQVIDSLLTEYYEWSNYWSDKN
jgi:hypothetical protein